MQLRIRLFLGYAYLVALLLVAVGSSALVFLHLNQDIDRILVESLPSVEASTRMLHALERQDSLTLLLLIDPQAEPSSLAPVNAAFEQALAEAEANLTEIEETPILGRIRASYGELLEVRQDFFVRSPADPLEDYRQRILPLFSRLEDDVFDLLAVNHEAMVERDREARQITARAGAWLAGLSTLALLSLPLLSRTLQRGVLDRLSRLHDTVKAIADGDTARRLQDFEHDELAFVAHQFNHLLDARDELDRRMEGRLAQQRQLLLGLLAELGEGAVLLGLDGSLIASTSTDPDPELLDKLRAWVVEPGRERIQGAVDLPLPTAREELDGAPRRIDLLVAHGKRPVAWLARPIDDD